MTAFGEIIIGTYKCPNCKDLMIVSFGNDNEFQEYELEDNDLLKCIKCNVDMTKIDVDCEVFEFENNDSSIIATIVLTKMKKLKSYEVESQVIDKIKQSLGEKQCSKCGGTGWINAANVLISGEQKWVVCDCKM